MRPGPARKTKSRHPPRRWRTLEGPEDHSRIEPRSCTRNLTIVRRQRQRLSFIRRGWSDPSAAEKINDLQGLAGFGAKPFRLAKLTACRKCRVSIGAAPECQVKGPELLTFLRFSASRAAVSAQRRTPLGTPYVASFGEVKPELMCHFDTVGVANGSLDALRWPSIRPVRRKATKAASGAAP